MRLEILGSGGSIITPKVFCNCESCSQAREFGDSHSRLGPSVFIHGPNILIDTPEEISIQINRSKIERIEACLYSHWHPDHTSGRRVFAFGHDLFNDPPKNKKTRIILPRTVAKTFKNYYSIMDHFKFMEQEGFVELKIIEDNQSIELGGYTVIPIQLRQEEVFGYRIQGDGQEILIIMDELKDWFPSHEVLNTGFDLVYLPFGIFDFNPINNCRLLPSDHFLMKEESTIAETLEIVKVITSKYFVLSHIEEPDNITIDLAAKLEDYYSALFNKRILIAKDNMLIDV